MLIVLSIGYLLSLAVRLRSMLLAVPSGCFSKTARSHIGHGEAGRGDHDLGPLAVVGRVQADDVAEGPAESAQAGEPNVQADVGDLAVGLAEHEHRPLDSSPLQVAVRGFPKAARAVPDVGPLGPAG